MTEETPRTSSILLTDLHKRYGDVVAVDNVSLRVDPGEIVAFLGRNGAGKSTTIDMLLGLTPPDRGEVQLCGETPARACSMGDVGAMLQIGQLPNNLSVGELARLVMRLYPKTLSFDDLVDRARIGDLLKQPTDKLSGGQRQRVRFALAIASDPKLLVLDEPTAAMDVEARRAFWVSLRDWAAQGRTVLFATHYLEEADSFADRIVLMRKGNVIADGPTTELRAMAGGRSIRFTMSHVDMKAMQSLPDVTNVEVHGDAVQLSSTNSDATLRALLKQHDAACDIEVNGAGIEDAFLSLTDDHDEVTA